MYHNINYWNLVCKISSKNIMGALYKGFIATALLSLLILYPLTNSTLGINENYSYSGIYFSGFDLYLCAVLV